MVGESWSPTVLERRRLHRQLPCLFRVLVHAGMLHVPGLLHCRFGCGAPHRRGSQPSDQRVELKTAVLEVKLRLVRLAEVSVWPSTISRSPRKSAVSF